MRIKELDGLRGLAVLAVIDCHYLAWLPSAGSAYGWLGVDLFFVLSGFLITSILLELRSQQQYFTTFYARRALRILPPYLLGLLVYIVVSIALREPGSLKLWSSYIFYYVSFFRFRPQLLSNSDRVPVIVATGLSVLWSLSVEEIYYTLWAPVIRYTREKGLIAIVVAMVLIAPLLRWHLHTLPALNSIRSTAVWTGWLTDRRWPSSFAIGRGGQMHGSLWTASLMGWLLPSRLPPSVSGCSLGKTQKARGYPAPGSAWRT